MIVDSHAHLVAPEVFYAYRAQLIGSGGYHKNGHGITDDMLAESAAQNIAIMDGVGTDVQFISPRPFQQMHSFEPQAIVHRWIAANNELIARTVQMHPDRFAGVAGLPLCAGTPVESCLPELNRAVEELGCVGVSVNPDPYEGKGHTPTLGDRFWYPLYERLVELDVPAMIHSAGCYNGREVYSDHFITEASIAVMSLMRSDVFRDFPTLKLMISHGGGSVPYQIGRWQAARLSRGLGDGPDAERFEVSLRRLWFDTVLYNKESLELLFKVVGPDRCLFSTEKPGSGSVVDPATGQWFDDLKPVIESIDTLTDEDRHAIFEGNARAFFPRWKAPTTPAAS
ncbi:amidohydrolase family protein [Planosporangium mesophilum]|uniref:4-oxalomesaconate hydratase n=1 Tax=Planosporangium mesophilum TaxID=689768 RepID=A0A8J3TEP4_9ACTN|nr:amidohydrolase family protein [Planosporangium mesophilum]NJC85874.1 amidohydrolase [Planosporangium mesophilum]GII25078.1 4-oxalomesaconate hydratase [Planosporangium mesophilum]